MRDDRRPDMPPMGGFQHAAKKLKWNQIVIAIVLIAIGILLILLPKTATGILCTIISILMVVAGAALILSFFLNKTTIEKLYLALGITLLLFGIACLIRNGLLDGILSLVFGIFVILDGSSTVAEAMTCYRAKVAGWIPMMVFGFIAIVLGAIVLFGSFDTVMVFVGVSLIVDGILDVIGLCAFNKKIKEARQILYPNGPMHM